MAELKVKIYSIVVVGTIPAEQITPAWLVEHGIVSVEDGLAAKASDGLNGETMLLIDKIELLIASSKLSLRTAVEGEVPILFDYVEGIFAVLGSAAIQAIGFNAATHYDVKSAAEWHRLGHKMAPKEPWHCVFPADPSPGLLTVTMQGARTDGFSGARNITFEPSKQVSFGVFININEHVSIIAPNDSDGGVGQLLHAVRHFRDVIVKSSYSDEEKLLS